MRTTDGTVRAVVINPLGSSLASDHLAGVTALSVYDAADFSEDGGTLRVGGDGGEVITYTLSAPESDTITLATPVVGVWPANTPVELWDATTGQPDVEHRAQVEVPGGQDNEEPIDAVVQHQLIPLLAEGIRDPGAGESVTLTQTDDSAQWVITNVLGRAAQLDGALIAPASIPRDSLSFTVGSTTTTVGAAPADPVVGDLWLDSGDGYAMHTWDGATWVPRPYGGGALADSSITTAKIAAGSITADLIAVGAIVAGAIAAGALDAMTISAGTLDAGVISAGSIGDAQIVNAVLRSSDLIVDDQGGQVFVHIPTGQTATAITAPGAGTWTCPVGVTQIKVECWGAGGGSNAGGGVGSYGGRGGAGGEYAKEDLIPVTPGHVYNYAVGAGGAGGAVGAGSGQAPYGGNTTFTDDLLGKGVTAHGGPGAWGGFNIAGATGSTNSVHFNGGGNFSSGAGSQSGEGGGGSAGTSRAGNPGAASGSNTVAGRGGAAVSSGGSGGNGGINTAVGQAGAQPGGGGGGGGGGTGSGGHAGGAGAAGKLVITYYATKTLLASISGVSGVDPSTGTAFPAGVRINPKGGGGNDTAWHLIGAAGEPAFANSWRNYAGGNVGAGFYKDAMGFVHLQGLIQLGTVGQTAFTLPIGYRPLYTESFAAIAANPGVARVDVVYTSGAVVVVAVNHGAATGSNGFVSLSGITFMAEN